MKSCGVWRAKDGTPFPRWDWHPSGACRGTIVAWHGMGGGPSDFENFGTQLAEQGWHVAAPAVRGQGLDPNLRRRGVFLDPEVIAKDIRDFSEEAFAGAEGLKIFAGESLGALLGAYAITTLELGFNGAIFSAPVVGLARPTPTWARVALRFLAQVAPRARLRPSWFVTGGPNAPKTSRDEAWIAAQKAGPQYIPAFGFAVLEAVANLMERVSQAAARLRTPCLVLAAGKDIFVTPEQIQHWFTRLAAPDKTLRIYPEAYHVLWNDWDCDLVLQDIADWLEERTPFSIPSASHA